MMAADTRLYEPAAVEARIRGLLPDVTVDVTPDAGHGLLFQHPAAVTATIRRFLAGHEPEGPPPPPPAGGLSGPERR